MASNDSAESNREMGTCVLNAFAGGAPNHAVRANTIAAKGSVSKKRSKKLQNILITMWSNLSQNLTLPSSMLTVLTTTSPSQ